MVAQLISLRWALFTNGFKRSPWQLVGAIIGALYALGVIVMAGVGLAFLGANSPQLAGSIAVLASAAVVLGWAIIPVFFTGMDGSMDPQRFALFPIPSRTLALGLLLAGFIGVPGLATLLFLMLTSLAYLSAPVALVLSVLGAIVGAFFAQLVARLGISLAGTMATRRGVREVASVLLFIPVFFVGPAIAQVGRNGEAVGSILPAVADWVRYTPFGAFGGLAYSLQRGDYLALGLGLMVGVASLVLAGWGYTHFLRRAIVTPPRIKSAAAVKGLGWVGRFPATPWGAVAGRATTYWLKDPRYAASLAIVPMLVILYVFVIPSLNSDSADGGFSFALVLGPLIGAVLGFSISADISYDSTAFSSHVLAGVSGAADRLGRVVALMVIGIPLTLLAILVPLGVSGDWNQLPGGLGAGLGALLTSAGLASVASARWTYSVPLPCDSPFKTPPGTGMRMALTQSALFLAILVFCAPTLGFYVASLVTGDPLWSWVTLAVGLVLGIVLAALGVRIGGRWMERRMPELMQAVMVNR